jgi:hypothetical protein
VRLQATVHCLFRRPVHYLSFPPGGALVPGLSAVM